MTSIDGYQMLLTNGIRISSKQIVIKGCITPNQIPLTTIVAYLLKTISEAAYQITGPGSEM